MASSVVDIRHHEKRLAGWMEAIKPHLSEVPETSINRTIFRVPQGIRSTNPSAYTPHIVSIGPFHHKNDNLLAMEEYKWNYMVLFLQRARDPQVCMKSCATSMFDLEDMARSFYAEKFDDSLDIAGIMMLDGCFLLELFLRYSVPDGRRTDPILTNAWMIWSLRRDLALLENQIPFSILEHLLVVLSTESGNVDLSDLLPELALDFYKPVLNLNDEMRAKSKATPCSHLLSLLRNCYIPPFQTATPECSRGEFTHTATRLTRAGIDFRKGTEGNLFEIKMIDGVIEIPPLTVNDLTESLFRNLIAFEQCSYMSTHYITSYIHFMDRIIDSASDVELLKQSMIIESDLGSSEEVAKLFNNFCKEVTLKDFYFQGVCNQISLYYKSKWHRHITTFKQTHCTDPWKIISLGVVTFILLLTGLQSTYSVLGYHRPPK